jgi:hypothetical protein
MYGFELDPNFLQGLMTKSKSNLKNAKGSKVSVKSLEKKQADFNQVKGFSRQQEKNSDNLFNAEFP